jgi:hypothetical protein
MLSDSEFVVPVFLIIVGGGGVVVVNNIEVWIIRLI